MSFHRSLEGISIYAVYEWRDITTRKYVSVCVCLCTGDFGTVM